MVNDRPVIEAHPIELSRSLSEYDITMIGLGARIGAAASSLRSPGPAASWGDAHGL